jgi:hypothetical protein
MQYVIPKESHLLAGENLLGKFPRAKVAEKY